MTRDEIVHYFKQGIGSGGFVPGSPLPVRRELLRICEASNVTVQRALNILIEEGFLRSRDSRGLEVAAHPPCTCRFGHHPAAGTRPLLRGLRGDRVNYSRVADLFSSEIRGAQELTM